MFIPSYRGKVSIDINGRLLVSGKLRNEVLCHFATPNTRLFLYRYAAYLSECRYEGVQARPIIGWVKYRLLTVPVECRSALRHVAGKLCRKILPDDLVKKLKARE